MRSSTINRSQSRAVEDNLRMRRLSDDRSLEAVLSTPEGRAFIWRVIAEICGIFRQSYTGNSETFFNEGRRAVGAQLLGEVRRLQPELYLRMVVDQEREDIALQQRVTDAQGDSDE